MLRVLAREVVVQRIIGGDRRRGEGGREPGGGRAARRRRAHARPQHSERGEVCGGGARRRRRRGEERARYPDGPRWFSAWSVVRVVCWCGGVVESAVSTFGFDRGRPRCLRRGLGSDTGGAAGYAMLSKAEGRLGRGEGHAEAPVGRRSGSRRGFRGRVQMGGSWAKMDAQCATDVRDSDGAVVRQCDSSSDAACTMHSLTQPLCCTPALNDSVEHARRRASARGPGTDKSFGRSGRDCRSSTTQHAGRTTSARPAWIQGFSFDRASEREHCHGSRCPPLALCWVGVLVIG